MMQGDRRWRKIFYPPCDHSFCLFVLFPGDRDMTERHSEAFVEPFSLNNKISAAFSSKKLSEIRKNPKPHII